MTHETPEQWLRELASRSSAAPPPMIDVTDAVMSSIHDMRNIAIPLDRTPLIVGGITIATAATLVLALLPSLTTMTQPWISFWLL